MLPTPDSSIPPAPPDAPPPAAPEKGSPWTDFLVAIQFLSVAPPVIKRLFTPQELGRSSAYYPLVGVLLGLVLIAADALLGFFFPLMLRSALLLAVWVLLTGALHLDGFLDACDGLLGGFTPEQRMTIMRDERVGAYALAGGILLLLTQWSAISSLTDRMAALLLAPVLGRWCMTLALVYFPYARPTGLGRDIKDHAGREQAVLASLFAVAGTLAAAWMVFSWVPLAAALVALLVAWGAARFTVQRIPGLTGDIYGAICLLVELSTLLVFVAGRRL
jgi:adenosylcobinamide-GDP ribazoletransferase